MLHYYCCYCHVSYCHIIESVFGWRRREKARDGDTCGGVCGGSVKVCAGCVPPCSGGKCLVYVSFVCRLKAWVGVWV